MRNDESRICRFPILIMFSLFLFSGCQSKTTAVSYHSDVTYKDSLDGEIPKAPLLFQYKFVSPVEEHEILLLDSQRKQYYVRIPKAKEAVDGFIVNLPAVEQYALAGFFIVTGKSKKELKLGNELFLFTLSQNVLTRIRGFDIINDSNPKSNSVSIAPWDGMTDNMLVVQAAKKFQIPEKSIRTINIFKSNKLK